MESPEASPKTPTSRKNIMLEVGLVIGALLIAFVVQAVISQTKPPKIPEFSENEIVDESADFSNETVVMGDEKSDESAVPAQYSSNLSSLGKAPDWSLLDSYQYCISKEEFLALMTEVYALGDYWENWFELHEDHVLIKTHAKDPSKTYKFIFKNEVVEAEAKTFWRTKENLKTTDSNKPLLGLRVAVDPGHIGGEYATIEGRRFDLKDGTPPVQEGNMTLTVADLLYDQLETLGASVTLVREKNEPINPLRVDDYLAYAESKLRAQDRVVTEESVRREASLLFYRTGEIRERARVINEEIKPDVVLCLHFNADSQPDPDNPVLFDEEHFHMILNGAYMEMEMANDDERFQMVMKMVQGVFREELELSRFAASAFSEVTKLKAYQYKPNSLRAKNVGGNPFLWARNMAANRGYECPVLFYEPYLQNGKNSHARMQVGDYGGLKYVNGKLQPSIYREYVNAVTKGLVEYYTAAEENELTEE